MGQKGENKEAQAAMRLCMCHVPARCRLRADFSICPDWLNLSPASHHSSLGARLIRGTRFNPPKKANKKISVLSGHQDNFIARAEMLRLETPRQPLAGPTLPPWHGLLVVFVRF